MIFSGRYITAFEVSWFVPDGSGDPWWASGALPARKASNSYEECIYQVVVRGQLSEKGHHGHMGMCERELIVEEVISAVHCKPA